jgi:hypothetical protein
MAGAACHSEDSISDHLQNQREDEPAATSALPDDTADEVAAPDEAAGDAPVRTEPGASPPGAPRAPARAEPTTSISDVCNCSPGGMSGTLVPATAVDATVPIRIPHRIVVLNARTGEALDPPVRLTSDSEGRFVLPRLPAGIEVALHVEGQGHPQAGNGTYDTVLLGFDASKSPLLRVWATGTASIAPQVAAFTPRQDRAQLTGSVYVTRGGTRVGTVGCAELFLDGAAGLASSKVPIRRLPIALHDSALV